MSEVFSAVHTPVITTEVWWFGQGSGENDHDKLFHDASEIVLKPKRALIVEDEMFVALHLETVLEELGLEVCEIVATGKDAFKVAISAEPDIIFMDINLRGDIDGVEATRLIREKIQIPIVFVTAYGDQTMLRRVKAVAPDSPVLQKPPMISALVAAIKSVTEDIN